MIPCVFTTGSDTALLRASCDVCDVPIMEYRASWTTYVDVKLRAGIRYLESVIYRSHSLMMWLDGNDSIVVRHALEIAKRWKEFGGGIVISAEARCWPDAELAEKYPPAKAPRFLNAGGFIGKAADLLKAMREVEKLADWDDQLAWTQWYLQDPKRLTIDHDRRIFSCVGDGPEALNADTCVLHWNGKAAGREAFWDGFVKGFNDARKAKTIQ